ncbi:hypothetical protein AB3S75_043033 [Citrus x aurantiifolia]
MAAIISNSSLIQTNALISLKPSHKLHPNHLSALSPPSPAAGLSFAAMKGNGAFKLSKNDKNLIIVIDNYDSFTYNLCQYMGELDLSRGYHFEVYRNDELTVEELKRKNHREVVISPGPGAPQDSGISLRTVLELGPTVPLFGVCMGLQCIGEPFGGKIVRSSFGVMHGKSSRVLQREGGG